MKEAEKDYEECKAFLEETKKKLEVSMNAAKELNNEIVKEMRDKT